MSENKFELPTYAQAKDRVIHGKSNPVEQFIYIFQPDFRKENVGMFRERLENALQYVIENVEPFGLTPRAPEQATQDALIQDVVAEINEYILLDDEDSAIVGRILRERLVR